MRFISICSGIEAASVAFAPLGWKAIVFSEIEPFPCAVLAHHYPDVPNLGDMTKFSDWREEIFIEADAIVGGPPCQAFSVAGKRNGLNDDRGNLTLIYSELIDHADKIRIAHGKQPVIVLYENVPGLLSDKTNAFGCFLGALAGEDEALVAPRGKWTNAGCVSGPQRTLAWTIADAQFFGVAQRRRRVFVVASARNGFNPAAVLFEPDSLRRDTPPSREAGQVAPTIPSRCTAGGGLRTDFDCDGSVITRAHTLRGEDFDASEDGKVVNGQDAENDKLVVCMDSQLNANYEIAPTLRAEPGGLGYPAGGLMMAVRRLTPEECEKLQGFPPRVHDDPLAQEASRRLPRRSTLQSPW